MPWRGPAGAARVPLPDALGLRSEHSVIGAFESMTTCLPPGRCTTTSGRTLAPWSLRALTWLSKSHRDSNPACSSTRRSCTSPHFPRTEDELQRSDQARSLVAKPLGAGLDARQLARDARELLAPLALQLVHLALHPDQALAQWPISWAVSESALRAVCRSTTRSRNRSRSARAPASRAAYRALTTSHATSPPVIEANQGQAHHVHAQTLPSTTDSHPPAAPPRPVS